MGELIQENVLPETGLAPIEMLLPLHMAAFEITDARGKGLTVMVTELDLKHPVALIVSTCV